MYFVLLPFSLPFDGPVSASAERQLFQKREEGRAAYARKDWDATIRLLLPLATKLPNDAELFNTLGNAYYFLAQAPANPEPEKQFDAALTQYRAALAVAPKNAVYFGNIGNLWRTRAVADSNPVSRREKWQEAATAYEKSATLQRGNAVDLNYLGMCYFALGRFADAERVQREAIDTRPNAGPAYVAGLWFNVGEDCSGQKNWPEAERAYREAAKLSPKIARFHNSLGLALFRQDRFADAEVEFRQALALDPKNPAHSANVAAAQSGQKKPSDR